MSPLPCRQTFLVQFRLVCAVCDWGIQMPRSDSDDHLTPALTALSFLKSHYFITYWIVQRLTSSDRLFLRDHLQTTTFTLLMSLLLLALRFFPLLLPPFLRRASGGRFYL